MSTPRSLVIRRVLAVLAVALAVSACSSDIVKDYGAQAQANFLIGCTTEVKTVNGKPVETSLAPRSSCLCIYKQISKRVGQLKFSDLTDYEAKVSAASDGNPPKMPDKLKAAITKCQSADKTGPTLPKRSSTTTTLG